jgi:hypothetical protein
VAFVDDVHVVEFVGGFILFEGFEFVVAVVGCPIVFERWRLFPVEGVGDGLFASEDHAFDVDLIFLMVDFFLGGQSLFV